VAGAAQTRPATVSGAAAAKALISSRRFMSAILSRLLSA
jgi:hypothetical protein